MEEQENDIEEQIYNAIDSNDISTLSRLEFNPNDTLEKYGISPLCLSIGLSQNSTKIVQLLLDRNGDPNNTDNEDQISPLHVCIMHDFDKVMALLLSYGADLTICTAEGKSCYQLLAENHEQLEDACFTYLYNRSRTFRRSLHPSQFKIPDCIMTLDSESENEASIVEEIVPTKNTPIAISSKFSKTPTPKKMVQILKDNSTNVLPYTYEMTEDESTAETNGSSSFHGLTPILEEEGTSAQSIVSSVATSQFFTPPSTMTKSSTSDASSSVSCANSTPPQEILPTDQELEALQQKVKSMNLTVPVTWSTYSVVSRQLSTSIPGKSSLTKSLLDTPSFSCELRAGIQDLNLINEWGNLAVDLIQANAAKSPPQRTRKSFFNYLLLDPKIIKRVNFSGNHLKSSVISNGEKFEKFLSAVFYIGKGSGIRPLQHLIDAKAVYLSRVKKISDKKLDKIVYTWKCGLGIMVHNIFHHISEKEANLNEAVMIDAMSVDMLSNIRRGSYNGTHAASWPQKTKNQFGSLLLHKAFCSFVVSDQKCLFPHDI